MVWETQLPGDFIGIDEATMLVQGLQYLLTNDTLLRFDVLKERLSIGLAQQSQYFFQISWRHCQ
jgi:hypothetical protein